MIFGDFRFLKYTETQSPTHDFDLFICRDLLFYRKQRQNQTETLMSRSGKDFTFGLLTGALVGSAIALLYAPDSGSNTRGKISYKVSSYADDLSNLIHQLKREQEKFSSEAKEKGDYVVSDAKKRADDLIKEAESLLKNIEKKSN